MLFLQVSRPITLKKDAIQTRNRKLAAKSKKRRSGSMDHFFKTPSTFSGYGMNSGYLTAAHAQYYAGQMGQMSATSGMYPMAGAAPSLGFPLH